LQLPPLDVESNTLTSTGAPLTDVVVATFTLDAPPQIPANFSVQVLWGDDSPADNNHVVADPSDPTRYEIRGTHTYAQPGTYTPGVIMSAFYGYGSNATIDVGGAAIDLYYRYTVVFSRNALVIQGGAGAAYSAPGTANTPTPPVFGLASAAGARVEVYATPAGGEPFRIGSGTVNGGGSWFIIPDVPLADGRYAITAQAFDDATGRASALTTLNDSLVIDTVAPRVVDVRFVPMRGEVVVTFRDYGGADDVGTGLDFASLTRPYSYSFSRLANPVRGYRGPSRWTVTAVDGEEARVGEPQQVAVRINRGRPIRGGTYLFTARSSFEIRDRAGNALQGGFDGTFPTQGPGDFVAQLSSLHRQVFPPQPAGAAPLSARVAARAKLAHARPRHG
jgi:hypothetical protein